MPSQTLIIVGALLVAALVATAVLLFTPGRRAARRARALEQAEQDDRMRHDPNAPHDLEEYRWDAKRTDTIHNFPGHI
jgi:hypothetical protein